MQVPLRSGMTTSERFSEIVRILIKHDFVRLVRRIATGDDATSKPTDAQYPPRQVREIMEELGPSFIKIGQLLGTRPDLVPAPYIEEFKRLFDRTTPTPFARIKPLIEEELGRPLDAVFARFEEHPIASASIGQVHRAILRTGEDVAVKVQHPGIEAAMENDFRILERIVRFTERVFAASRVWQPVDHLAELKHMLDKELDYRNEQQVMRKVATHFADVHEVHIPKVYRDFCTRRIMTMEFVDGHKLDALTKARSRNGHAPSGTTLEGFAPDDGPRIARIITHAMAKQIFIDRIFHADPSPGNILVRSDGSVSFLDWGAVGTVTRRRSRTIFQLIANLSRGDPDTVARNVMDLCEVRGEIDAKRYQNDIERLLDYYEKEDASPADPVIIDLIITIAADHNMLLPPDFMLITRALYQFEGFCRAIDPDYELVAVLKPYVSEVMREVLYGPERQKELVSGMVTEYGELLQDLPGRVTNIVRKLEKDEIALNVHLGGLTDWKRANAKNARIISFSVLMAAVIVGVGVVLTTGTPRLLGSYFFFAAFVTTLWVLVMLASTWVLKHGE